LTLEAMVHPVRCSVDGRVYERAAIEAWVQAAGNSPVTRQPVTLRQLSPVRYGEGRRGEVGDEAGDDDDDDDAQSITTDGGWPRARTARGQPAIPAAASAATSDDFKPSFLVALLAGGGGVESANAKALATARPPWARRSGSSRRDAAHRQQENEPGSKNATGAAANKRALTDLFQGQGEDGDASEWAAAAYDFHKGRGVTRVKGRLVVAAGRSLRGVGVASSQAQGLMPARWGGGGRALLLPTVDEGGMSDDGHDEGW